MEYPNRDWFNCARIDLKNRGEGNDIKVKVLDGKKCLIYNAPWFSKEGKGYVLESREKHLMLEIECQGAGALLIRMLGLDRRLPEGERLPLLIDYTKLDVNDEVIFGEIKSQCHDRPYQFIRQVKDGEIVRIEISWDNHAYKGDELAKLLSLWGALPQKMEK